MADDMLTREEVVDWVNSWRQGDDDEVDDIIAWCDSAADRIAAFERAYATMRKVYQVSLALHRENAALRDVYQTALALHACEDFEQEPCWHDDCAPADRAAYQAKRAALYQAITAARALLATDAATPEEIDQP